MGQGESLTSAPSAEASEALCIEDYALIGDCLTRALVGRNGSIDCLCWPRFDSGARFAALLGSPQNGRWQISPVDASATATRSYRGDTMVLETRFETAEGSVALIDFMPYGKENSSVVRRIEGRRGRVRMRLHLTMRFDYASSTPWVTELDDGSGLCAILGPNLVVLRTAVDLRGENKATVAEFDVDANESIDLVLTWGPSHLPPPPPLDAVTALADTERFWAGWSADCRCQGPWRTLMLRSLLTLKALTFAPTGGIATALTTSLPEQLGGSRNWDYRYCWLRNATLTLVALMDRVAAMTIGIVAVFVVNNLFAGTDAVDSLETELRERADAITSAAVAALEGRSVGDGLTTLHVASGAAALHTQSTYAVRELPDGRIRSNAARTVIASLLAMVSAARDLGRELGPDTPAVVRKHLDAVVAAIRTPTAPQPVAPWPTRPSDALILECADELLMQARRARIAQDVLVEGKGDLPAMRLRASHDVPGALLAACRSMFAVGLGSLVCIYSDWSGATLVLIMQSAFTALLAQAPNPRAASLSFVVPLLPMALLIGVIEFILLPNASGFVPFAAAVAPVALAAALLTRLPLLASLAPVAFLYVPLFLAPSNAQTYNFATYCNTVMQVGLAVLLTVLSFDLVLRVSPSRRFYRVAAELAADLRRTLRRSDRLLDEAPAQSVLFDPMMRAMTWMGRETPARVRLLHEMYGIGEVDLAIRRARTGLAQLQAVEPRLAQAASLARQALESGDANVLLRAGQAMLDHPSAAAVANAVRETVSAMASAAHLIGKDRSARRLYRRLTA